MVNNVGKTNTTLSTNLGEITETITASDINIISGVIGLGFLLFDSDGTLGVVSEFTDTSNFTVKTYALSVNIENILNLEY